MFFLSDIQSLGQTHTLGMI